MRNLDYARSVDLPAILDAMGLQRDGMRCNGNEMFYFSPFREETSASLHLTYTDHQWFWYDFGEGKGGDAIEMYCLLHRCTFQEAVAALAGPVMPITPVAIQQHRRNKAEAHVKTLKQIAWARHTYNALPSSDHETAAYFAVRNLPYYPEIGCKVFNHFKEHRRYLAIPLPNPAKCRGLELREICTLDTELYGEKCRKAYGPKTPWLFKRGSKMLITESFLDALAGDVILGGQELTLVSINGAGNAHSVGPVLDYVKPEFVFMALDRDEPGRKAQAVIHGILEGRRIPHESLKFAAKDLFRELHGKGIRTAKHCQANLGANARHNLQQENSNESNSATPPAANYVR
jgi:hypothetical protein